MNKKAIFFVLIFFCKLTNLIAIETPRIKKMSPVIESKKALKPVGDRYFWLGVHATSLSLMRTGTTFGLGVNGLFSASGQNQAYFIDFNNYFPIYSQNEEYIYSNSTAVTKDQLKIKVNYKISGRSARLGYRICFLNYLVDDGFRLYLQAFAGIQFLNVSSTSESYDKLNYTPQYKEAYTASVLIFGGGFGSEYSMGSKLNVFADMNLNHPVWNVGAIKVDADIPIAMKLTLGTKFLF